MLDYSNFGSVGDSAQGNPAATQLGNLSQLQSAQSQQVGANAANYADPWMQNRKKYQDQLDLLMSNPGAQSTSPYYKYLMDTAMNQVQARNAATGNLRSGAGAMALQDRAANVASQGYGQQEAILAKLAGVDSSSPAAAANSYGNFMARSQNQGQQAVAQRNAPGGGTGLPTGNIGSAGRDPFAGQGMGGASDPYNPTTNPMGYQATPNYVPYQFNGGGATGNIGNIGNSGGGFGGVTNYDPNDMYANNMWDEMAGSDYGGYGDYGGE